ncbi:M14 family metallopeptidase [Rhodospirillaceae bacterium SYSU D60014]|uniref:M14 family metallopeptidase n=1 Tax=Virgifigura deserti TaxID=2268457 RepID=UPI000E660C75
MISPGISPDPTIEPCPIELQAPDISPYRDGNTGVPFVTRLDSGRPGPHALVTALVHGNELCGAVALDFLLRNEIRPIAGTLTLAFANTDAFARFDPGRPTQSRYVDEDFNRLWSPAVLDGRRHSSELRRARSLRPVVDQADFLLDLHSMQHKTEPLALAGPLEKGRRLARAIGFPAVVVCDPGHASGRRLRDYGAFADPASPRNALLVECGQHWERSSAGVAIDMALRFLLHLGTIDPAIAARHLSGTVPAQQRIVEVTEAVIARSDRFRFAAPYRGLEVIAEAGTVIAEDDGRPVVTPYDSCVLVMPTRCLVRGQTAVRLGRFIA